MRPPPRSPFHHSDLGGPFAAFAPELRERDQGLNREAGSSRPLSYPIRLQRSPVLSMLIDALRQWCAKLLSSSRSSEPPAPVSGRTDHGRRERRPEKLGDK